MKASITLTLDQMTLAGPFIQNDLYVQKMTKIKTTDNQ